MCYLFIPLKEVHTRLVSRSVGLAFALGVVASLVLASLASSQQASRRTIGPGGPGTENPNFASSLAVQVGDTLYVAGQIGTVERTGNFDADLEKEIRTVLDNIQAVVEEAGLTMDDLVWVQVFCTNLALYGKFNDIYRTYFTGPLPARAFVGTSTLLINGHFEVMGIAVRP